MTGRAVGSRRPHARVVRRARTTRRCRLSRPRSCGVVPWPTATPAGTICCPRARGGPNTEGRFDPDNLSSRARGDRLGRVEPVVERGLVVPRARRGWSDLAVVRQRHVAVVPAHAGVVRPSPSRRPPRCGGPRASGGGPKPYGDVNYADPSSPRRRGGCRRPWTVMRSCMLSLRTRGWSVRQARPRPGRRVVSAHAGVVPCGSP